MDATDQTPGQTLPTPGQTLPQVTPQITPQISRPIRDRLDVLGDGPLGVPVWRLWEGLDMLVQDGPLRGVELDLTHADCPCFLLDVPPGLPRLYVEVFLDDSPAEEGSDPEETYDAKEEWRPLLVLANWLGEDTDPAIFELEPGLREGEASDWRAVLAPVLDHVLRMVQSRG